MKVSNSCGSLNSNTATITVPSDAFLSLIDSDGGRKTDITIYRANTGVWWIYPSGAGSSYTVGFGGDPSDIPVTTNFPSLWITDIDVSGIWIGTYSTSLVSSEQVTVNLTQSNNNITGSYSTSTGAYCSASGAFIGNAGQEEYHHI